MPSPSPQARSVSRERADAPAGPDPKDAAAPDPRGFLPGIHPAHRAGEALRSAAGDMPVAPGPPSQRSRHLRHEISGPCDASASAPGAPSRRAHTSKTSQSERRSGQFRPLSPPRRTTPRPSPSRRPARPSRPRSSPGRGAADPLSSDSMHLSPKEPARARITPAPSHPSGSLSPPPPAPRTRADPPHASPSRPSHPDFPNDSVLTLRRSGEFVTAAARP